MDDDWPHNDVGPWDTYYIYIYVGGSCSISKHLTATDGRSTGASQQNARLPQDPSGWNWMQDSKL